MYPSDASPLFVPKFSSLLSTFLVPSNDQPFSLGYSSISNLPSSLWQGDKARKPGLTYLPSPAGKDSPPPWACGSHCRAGFQYYWPTADGKAWNFSANSVNSNLKYPLLQEIIRAKTGACAIETSCNCLILYPKRNWIHITGNNYKTAA